MAITPITLSIIAFVGLILGGTFQVFIQPLVSSWGYSRELVPLNNAYCKTVPQLAACEKIILHQETGLIYLACSLPASRSHWTPTVDRLNETGASFNDYVATYDPETSVVTRLKVNDFASTRGLSLHGMDVVPSSADPSELFLYLVNHRAPLGAKAKNVGADSVIEIFKTTLGSNAMSHVKTVDDPVIITPNDVVGGPDGKSFYFTNDHGAKVGHVLDVFGRSTSSVGYCHIDKGCHFAIQHMHGNNGIARAPNGTVYVANSLIGGLSILEPQADNTLVLTDIVAVDRAMDNLAVDSEGYVWSAAFPYMLTLLFKHFEHPHLPSPSTVFRFSINTGPDATLGVKYKVEKMFEDDGKIASGITSAVYDVQRNLLFLDGLASPHLAVCKL
ncbi:serum paraoxonase/arylesterase [Flammula alnicola]|nr:serum paraoxonase/arylesterase [Flammula alnicola]